jgi:peptidoglycan/LPS O-acetylase OafA/YrhL
MMYLQQVGPENQCGRSRISERGTLVNAHRFRSKTLSGLLAFGGTTAVAGMVGLLTRAASPPDEMLAGTPFSSYLGPALILGGVVGGSQLVAWSAKRRRAAWSGRAAFAAGAIMTGWIIGQIYLIGSEAGASRNLQMLYLLVGVLELVLATPGQSTHRKPTRPDRVAAGSRSS